MKEKSETKAKTTTADKKKTTEDGEEAGDGQAEVDVQ